MSLAAVALSLVVGVHGEHHVIVFSKTAGYRHRSIPHGIVAIEEACEAINYHVRATEDAGVFTDETLQDVDVVVFLSTTGDILNERQQAAFERFIRAGGGFVGVHAATDTEYDWPWYGRLVGAYFASHPAIQEATIAVADSKHPTTKMLPRRWTRTDEWYSFHESPRGKVHVLATLDESTYDGGGMSGDHPIIWCHEFEGGRAWYTGGGHTAESFAEPLFMEHLVSGLRWAAGDHTRADSGATIDRYFEKVVLDDFVTDPMELAVAPDGRVVFVERGGIVKIWKPDTHKTVTAGFLDVFTALEDGLLGVTLDPGFADNGWLYLYYAPAGDEAVNVLSRFTLVGDTIDPGSEIVLLEVATQREECCHSGGSLAFDGRGNLYLSTGDNTSPFASSGFSPIDEREGRGPFDAQKSSANTHDLRGKILRITPQPDGGYAIPEGNLFPADGSQGRPEIYVMGCRNPFRISVDTETGILYWGEVGPDAGSERSGRGPAGYDEFNRARGPGNFGWPYFIADNKAYHDHDFEQDSSGVAYEASRPINESPNNTGRRELPPATPAWLWYPYGVSAEFPQLGQGGRCAMAGPVYRFDRGRAAVNSLPEYYDATLFLYEWARDWIVEVKLDADGEPVTMSRFLPELELTRPMDLELGADGRLYLIEWGTGFGGGNPDSLVARIDYHPTGRRPPSARAAANRTSGPTPLTVTFADDGSRARSDRGELTHAWDLDGDGRTDAEGPRARHVYREPGLHTAQLTVTDAYGLSSVANVTVCVGNTQPVVTIDWPPDGGFFEFGDSVEYRVTVTDAEDGTVRSDEVVVQPFLGHDTHAHPLHQYAGVGGVFRTLRDDGHGADADLFTVLHATYTDHAAAPAVPMTTKAEVVLQPKRKQAEYAADRHRARIEKADDPDGGGQALVFNGPNAHAVYRPVNFHGIDSVQLRLAAGATGGTLELRIGDPDGPLLAVVEAEARGGVELDERPHDIRIEYFERGGGAGLIWRMQGTNLPKQVVDASMLTHDGSPGLHAAYYELDDPTVLPDFSTLTPYATGVVERVDFASTDGAFAGSGRADHLGVVLTGQLTVPRPGRYVFWLESDDGSRLHVDGQRVVNNPGLHAMVEKSAGFVWTDVEVPIANPGGTHELYVVCRGDDGVTMKLNWMQFGGPGVAASEQTPLARPETPAGHDHDHHH